MKASTTLEFDSEEILQCYVVNLLEIAQEIYSSGLLAKQYDPFTIVEVATMMLKGALP